MSQSPATPRSPQNWPADQGDWSADHHNADDVANHLRDTTIAESPVGQTTPSQTSLRRIAIEVSTPPSESDGYASYIGPGHNADHLNANPSPTARTPLGSPSPEIPRTPLSGDASPLASLLGEAGHSFAEDLNVGHIRPTPARYDTDSLDAYPPSTASKSPLATPGSEVPGTSATHDPSPLASPMPSQSSELAVSPYASEHDLSRASPAGTPSLVPTTPGLETDYPMAPANTSSSNPTSPPPASSAPATPAPVEHEHDHVAEGEGHKKESIVDKIHHLLGKSDSKEAKEPKG